MQTRITYLKLFFGILALSVVAIGVLSILLLAHGPRVRFVQFDEGSVDRAYTNGATVVVHFDRPLAVNDYSSVVSFTPELKTTVSVSGQTLRITAMQNLDHDTKYTLYIAPGIVDTNRVKMSRGYSHTFQTSSPRFAYIERNYTSSDVYDPNNDAMDHIKVGTIGSDKRDIIFSHPEIRLLAANSTRAVVVVREAEADAIYSVSLKGGEAREEKLLFGGRITSLALAPLGNTALMSVVPDFTKVSREYYNEFAHRVISLDLNTGETKSLSTSGGSYVYATNIQMDGLGQVALIQDLQAQFFAVSPYNDYDPILLGTYVSSEGIRPDASEIVFQNDFDWERYNVATSERTPLELKLDVSVDQIRLGDGALISVLNYEDGGTKAEVYRYTSWQDNPLKIWTESANNGVSLYTFSASFDETLLALQFNYDKCQFDRFETNTQCTDTSTTLVDTDTGKTVDEFKGFDLVWIP